MESCGGDFVCNFYMKFNKEERRPPPVRNVVISIPSIVATHFQIDEEMNEIDQQSRMGRFGWPEATTDYFYGVPYILRNSVKYFAVQMALTRHPIKMFLSLLSPEIYKYYRSVTECVTQAECRLLNEINIIHCESRFGTKLFTTEALLIKDTDAYALHAFLNICYRKLHFSNELISKIGFIQFSFSGVYIPYVTHNNEPHMPLYCFSNVNNLKIDFLSGWDLAYLRFCCLYQGIWKGSHEILPVVSLSAMKGHIPEDATIVTSWPEIIDHGLLRAGAHSTIGRIVKRKRSSELSQVSSEKPVPLKQSIRKM